MKYYSNALIWFFCTMLLIQPVLAAEKGQGRNEKDVARDKLSKGPEIVELVDIAPGMTILDLLGGDGYYSELLAAKVGDSGQVYLHNNKAYMPYVEKALEQRLANNRLANVKRLDREMDALSINAQQFDAVFFVLGYHDIYHKAEGWDIDKKALFSQLFPAIKPHGKLVVIDHSAVANSGTKHAQELHRIDKQFVIDELADNGFRLIKDSHLLKNPQDTRLQSPFEPHLRRKTDRFILIFEKI